MENNLIIRINNKGIYYEVVVIQIHVGTSSTRSNGVETTKPCTWESTVLTFGKSFLVEADAEKFAKSKAVKAILKAAAKLNI